MWRFEDYLSRRWCLRQSICFPGGGHWLWKWCGWSTIYVRQMVSCQGGGGLIPNSIYPQMCFPHLTSFRDTWMLQCLISYRDWESDWLTGVIYPLIFPTVFPRNLNIVIRATTRVRQHCKMEKLYSVIKCFANMTFNECILSHWIFKLLDINIISIFHYFNAALM